MVFVKHLSCALFAAGILCSEPVMAETVQMTVDNRTYPVEMSDTVAARNFASRLPMTLVFENFGSKERIAYPEPAIDTGTAVKSFEITKGTITIYKPWGNIAVFLVDYPWDPNLVELGKLNAEALEAVRSSGSRSVTFSK